MASFLRGCAYLYDMKTRWWWGEMFETWLFSWQLNCVVMWRGKMTPGDAETKGGTQRCAGTSEGCGGGCLGGAAVRDMVSWIAHVGWDHAGLVHKVFVVRYWKQNELLIRKEGGKELKSLKHLCEEKLNTTGFTFPLCETVFLKGFEKFSCVAPKRFMLVCWLTWLSFFLNIVRTQSNTKSKWLSPVDGIIKPEWFHKGAFLATTKASQSHFAARELSASGKQTLK